MTAGEATDVLRLCFAVYRAAQDGITGGPPHRDRLGEPARLGGVVGSRERTAAHSQGGRPTSTRSSDDRTVPKRPSSAVH